MNESRNETPTDRGLPIGEDSSSTGAKEVSPKKTAVLLLIVLAIIPWAMFYTSYLAPSVHSFLGLDRLQNLRIGFLVVPILVPPALLIWALFRNDPE